MQTTTQKTLITTDCYLTDSHCHLLDEPLYTKLPSVFEAAFVRQVQQFLVPCSRLSDFSRLHELLAQYPFVHGAFGIHPFYVAESSLEVALEQLSWHLLKHPNALVGEIGLDFAERGFENEQRHFFQAQLSLAQEHQRPVVLHHRKSLDAMLSIIKQMKFSCGGLLHAYSGSIEQAKPWLELGFKLGIGSVLLKPSARKIHQLLPHLRFEDFVLETDAPYMVSSSMNQAHNEPKFVRDIAEILAKVYDCSWQDIARHSNATFASIVSQ